jgi:DNA-directed RNA polymerase subunit RPC12/RpoP
MADIVELDEHRPYLSGFVKCLHCGHIWEDRAIIRNDKTFPVKECPKCGLCQGHFLYSVAPNEGDNVFTCGCGCDSFFIIKNRGYRCMRCGFLHTDVEIFDR